MSLDVYLILEGAKRNGGSGIFVRKDGATVEISREEWDQRNPGIEPITYGSDYCSTVYEANITHNLVRMADAAGIYKALWRPEEIGITYAEQLLAPLADGLAKLRLEPEKYEAFNSPNGWGMYENFVPFVASYLDACRKYPAAIVRVSR